MSDEKAKRDRSPSYPFISLKDAIARLEDFEKTFGRHPAPASKAGLAWGMKIDSSQAFQTLAALKSFGLLKYEGSSADRKAMLTEDARTFLRAQQESVKKDVLRKLATKPAQILKFWNIWGADRPLDAICLDELILKNAFTDSSARTFLKVYDATIDFAGLELSNSEVGNGGNPEAPDTEFLVGDLVQWESGGQIQWREPRNVIAIDEHEDGHLFYKVGGPSDDPEAIGWIPVEEAVVANAKPLGGQMNFKPPRPDVAKPEVLPPMGQRKAVFPVSEGDVTFLFPEALTLEGLEELQSYLDIFLKKEQRKLGATTSPNGPSQPSAQ